MIISFFKMEEEHIWYTPNPVDTNDVILSDDLLALTERIATNVHDVWHSAGYPRVGCLVTLKTMKRKSHPCLFHMMNFLNLKKTMTGILRWKH